MTDQKPPALAFPGSRLFTAWLKEAKVSLAMTTYQAGKVFLIGLQPDGRLSVFERTFERPMGLGVGQGRFWMSSIHQLWRFEDFLDKGETRDGYDALYVPVTGHTTGDLDIHDIHEDANGQPVFVATRFNCLATLAERGSFRELWRPPFLHRFAARDRRAPPLQRPVAPRGPLPPQRAGDGCGAACLCDLPVTNQHVLGLAREAP